VQSHYLQIVGERGDGGGLVGEDRGFDGVRTKADGCLSAVVCAFGGEPASQHVRAVIVQLVAAAIVAACRARIGMAGEVLSAA
jgi:hypothetical protein